MPKNLRVGLDFDGVIAYNPVRIFRAYIKWFKKKILKKSKLSFVVPKSSIEKLAWILVHKSSIWPAPGAEKLTWLSKQPGVELYLITGRYALLEQDLERWLVRYGLKKVFRSINMNLGNEQPHEFKLRKARELKLDYYIEDNLDVVLYMAGKSRTKVLWISNIVDRSYPYRYKFSALREAMNEIQ